LHLISIVRNPLKPGQSTPTPHQPLWLRVAALVCVLLIAVMSTAQVCHTHTPLASSSGSHQTAPDNCPLCVAMHSALPATLRAAPEPVLHMRALDSAAADAERLFRWRFQLASRPPPVDSARA
jgi:hypothetical protein